jgi:hypothetical protein
VGKVVLKPLGNDYLNVFNMKPGKIVQTLTKKIVKTIGENTLGKRL